MCPINQAKTDHRYMFEARNTSPVYYSPIQLLRPPGLCSAVWLIFTKLTPSCCLSTIIDVEPGTSKVRCGTSSRGLVTIVGVLAIGLRKLLKLLSGHGLSGDSVSFHIGVDTDELGTGRKASAYHSYQTLRGSVSRHSETVSSASAGRYNGSCNIRDQPWLESK